MRYLILFVLIIVLASCTPPAEPTPTEPPAPTATATPLPALRASAEELAASIKGQIAGVEEWAELRALVDTLDTETVNTLCLISEGVFEPELTTQDLTDSGTVDSLITLYCIRLHST